jgi:hypothetical protein
VGLLQGTGEGLEQWWDTLAEGGRKKRAGLATEPGCADRTHVPGTPLERVRDIAEAGEVAFGVGLTQRREGRG